MMNRLRRAFRIGFAVYRIGPEYRERYEDFAVQFRWNNAGQFLTDSEVRLAHDQWRRSIIKSELRSNLVREVFVQLLSNRDRRIALLAMTLLALALLFPPFHASVDGTTAHLGIGFMFGEQVGQVDALYLLCEIIGIMAMYWLARQATRTASGA